MLDTASALAIARLALDRIADAVAQELSEDSLQVILEIASDALAEIEEECPSCLATLTPSSTLSAT